MVQSAIYNLESRICNLLEEYISSIIQLYYLGIYKYTTRVEHRTYSWHRTGRVGKLQAGIIFVSRPSVKLRSGKVARRRKEMSSHASPSCSLRMHYSCTLNTILNGSTGCPTILYLFYQLLIHVGSSNGASKSPETPCRCRLQVWPDTEIVEAPWKTDRGAFCIHDPQFTCGAHCIAFITIDCLLN